MPNLNGTGPLGKGSMTGRRKGRCRDAQSVQNPEQSTGEKEIIYGLGRGGRPRGGGGLGNRFGGGSRKGQGRGRGRGFGAK